MSDRYVISEPVFRSVTVGIGVIIPAEKVSLADVEVSSSLVEHGLGDVDTVRLNVGKNPVVTVSVGGAWIDTECDR